MQETTLISQLKNIVRERFLHEGADHDWFHIERVYRMAMYLQSVEGGDPETIACATLLHDISDHKLNGGKLNDGGRVAKELLLGLGQSEAFAEEVARIVDGVSFKGAGVADTDAGIALSIVRDADRLDAMGALGIARAFHFGGSRNRPFYVPGVGPREHLTFEAYANDRSHTLNHFHEKLLLLKDRLQTKTAKAIGEKRHRLMADFVEAFYDEWQFGSSAAD